MDHFVCGVGDGAVARPCELEFGGSVKALDVAELIGKVRPAKIGEASGGDGLAEFRFAGSSRRLLGGFYAYDSTTETKRIGSGCSGTTDARGFLFCSVKPSASGELVLLARAKDDAGRESFATAGVWVRGNDEWWFEPANNDRIDLIPEKKRYEPGETAKFQVRMPFRAATVLVTVEREGVLSQQVVEVDAKSPVIEVPVVGSYGPNVFV